MFKRKKAIEFIDLSFTHLINNPCEEEYMYLLGVLNTAKTLGLITEYQYLKYVHEALSLRE